MKVLFYETESEWLADRPGKITGSKLNDIVTHKGNGVKAGKYQLIADKLGLQDGDHASDRDRGHRLEKEAIEAMGKKLGMKFETDLVMWVSDKSEDIAFSPDGFTKNLTIAAEAKCLGSGLHIEAVITKSIPAKHKLEYTLQMLQAFIVNPKLKEHYLGFYDDRLPACPLVTIKTTRKEVADDIKFYLDYELQTLEWVDEWVGKLAF